MHVLRDAVETRTIGLIGARGYAGRALIDLLDGHRHLALAWASSRSHAGEPVDPDRPTGPCFRTMPPEAIDEHPADVYVLATPDGRAAQYVEAIDRRIGPETRVIDLSADHRFDPAWAYGLPEIDRAPLRGARRVANPGCYATAVQLALHPLRDRIEAAHVFGVSGHSGAGATPSPRNDPERLRDNVIPYKSTGHAHEREVRHRLAVPVRFLPSVASFFRGIVVTASVVLDVTTSVEELVSRYEAAYGDEPLIDLAGESMPLLRDSVDGPRATIGGIHVDRTDARTMAVSATLDNLMKGAASQALQNINLMCGYDELEGLTV